MQFDPTTPPNWLEDALLEPVGAVLLEPLDGALLEPAEVIGAGVTAAGEDVTGAGAEATAGAVGPLPPTEVEAVDAEPAAPPDRVATCRGPAEAAR